MEYSDRVRFSADVPPIGGLPLVMPGIILDRCRTNSVLHHSYIPGGVLCLVRFQAFSYLNLLHTDALPSLSAAPYDVGHLGSLLLRIPPPALVRKSIRLLLLMSFFSWLSTTSAVRGKHSSPLLLFRLPCLPRLRLVVLIQFTHSAYYRLETCCLFVAPLLFVRA